MSKGGWLVVALVSVVIGVSGCTIGALTQEDSSGSGEQKSTWLCSQTAKDGSILPSEDDTSRLTLKDVDPVILGFQDRPMREAQTGTVQRDSSGHSLRSSVTQTRVASWWRTTNRGKQTRQLLT